MILLQRPVDELCFTSAYRDILGGFEVFLGSARSSTHDANEDAVEVNREKLLFGVSDGITNGRNGSLASRLALRTLLFSPRRLTFQNAMEQFHATHEQVKSALLGEGGATAVVARLGWNEIQIYNVGDSRAYLIVPVGAAGRITSKQITSDHVVPLETTESSIPGGASTRLAQALGFWVFEVGKHAIQPPTGAVVLLCTDGLYSDQTSLRALETTLVTGSWFRREDSLHQCREILLSAAQGGDDCTFLAIRYFGPFMVRPALWYLSSVLVCLVLAGRFFELLW